MTIFARALRSLLGARPPADLLWITPELSRSVRFVARQAPALRQLEIGAVLDLRPDERHELAPLGKAGLHYFHLPIGDDAGPTVEELTRASDWVVQELRDDRKVLVHARAGGDRGAAVVSAVLLRTGYSMDETLALMRERCPEASLSEAQAALLRQYAQRLGR